MSSTNLFKMMLGVLTQINTSLAVIAETLGMVTNTLDNVATVEETTDLAAQLKAQSDRIDAINKDVQYVLDNMKAKKK